MSRPPPKKTRPLEDARSPLEIAISNTTEQLRVAEAQLLEAQDGVKDLSTHTTRIKQLDSEMSAREGDVRAAATTYARLMDHATAVKRVKVDEETQSPSVSPRRGPQGVPLSSEDAHNREILRQLQTIVRENVGAVVGPIFQQGRTPLEKHNDLTSRNESPELEKSIRGKGGKTADSARREKPVDTELYLPPGLDTVFYQDVLLARDARIVAESKLADAQEQLSTSRQIVATRAAEGCSKGSVRRLEKQVTGLRSALNDLNRQRDEDALRRRNTDAALPKLPKKK